MMLKPVAVLILLGGCTLAACSNVLTYIRHDEGRNTTCDGQKGIKRDTGGNCTIQSRIPE